jgi:hypothetical protein
MANHPTELIKLVQYTRELIKSGKLKDADAENKDEMVRLLNAKFGRISEEMDWLSQQNVFGTDILLKIFEAARLRGEASSLVGQEKVANHVETATPEDWQSNKFTPVPNKLIFLIP